MSFWLKLDVILFMMSDKPVETIISTNPFTNKELEVSVKDITEVDSGAENKSRLTGELRRGDKAKEVKLYLKSTVPFNTADSYIVKWQEMKAAGLPVVPTLRKASDSSVLMTDLTHDGSELYGKSRNWYPSAHNSKLKDVFDSLDLKKIEDAAKKIAEQASKNGIGLPDDDPMELLIHPDGSWEIIILDLTETVSEPSNKINRINRLGVHNFLKFIHALRVGKTVDLTMPWDSF